MKVNDIATKPVGELVNLAALTNRFEYNQGQQYEEDEFVEWQLASSILHMIPDQVVRYGLRVIFGDGKYTRTQAEAVNTFRLSGRAKVLYGLWRGKDYKPTKCFIPRRAYKPNGKLVIHYIDIEV